MLMLMMAVIVAVLMLVHRGLMAVFMAVVGMGHLFMGMLMHMLVFFLMGVGMMTFIMGVLMSMHGGLVAVFMALVAVGHFLVTVLMLMLVFLAHSLPPYLFRRRPIGKLRPEHRAVFGVFFLAVLARDGLLFVV
jgi:hypothetical protein